MSNRNLNIKGFVMFLLPLPSSLLKLSIDHFAAGFVHGFCTLWVWRCAGNCWFNDRERNQTVYPTWRNSTSPSRIIWRYGNQKEKGLALEIADLTWGPAIAVGLSKELQWTIWIILYYITVTSMKSHVGLSSLSLLWSRVFLAYG